MPAVALSARVVEVIGDLGPQAQDRYRYGSGCLVGGPWVLTAAHVVARAVSVTIRDTGKHSFPAVVDADLVGDVDGPRPDLALVRVVDRTFPADLPPMPVAAVDRSSPSGGVVDPVYAVGYPWFGETPGPHAVRDTVHALGVVPVLSTLVRGLLTLEVRQAPRALPPQTRTLTASEWSGMSGAPVLASGRLIGVVTEHAPRAGPSAITATPLTSLQADPKHPGWGEGVANPDAWWSRLGVGPSTDWPRLPQADRAAEGADSSVATAFPRPPEPFIPHAYTLLDDGFLGRREELAALDAWIDGAASSPVYCLVAIGGMGKSALAWRWFTESATSANHHWAGRIWWSFYEADASMDQFIVDALCYVSGMQTDAVLAMDPARRALRLLERLAEAPFLVGLDGIERALIAYSSPKSLALAEHGPAAHAGGGSAEAGRLARRSADPAADAFLKRLLQLRTSRVLISTRLFPAAFENRSLEPTSGVVRKQLDGLDRSAAQELVRRSGVRTGVDAILDVLASVNYHPLVAQVLAGDVARYRPAPGNYLAWRDRHKDFSPASLDLVQRRSHILEHALQGLTPAEADVMSVISALSGPAPYDWLETILVARGTVKGDQDLSELLAELEGRGIVGWDRADNRYDMHPVIRGAALDRLRSTTSGGRDVYASLRRHFEALPDPAVISGWQDLVPLAELFLATAHEGLDVEALTIYRERLHRPLRQLGDATRVVELLTAFIDGAPNGPVTVTLSRRDQQAYVLNELAIAHVRLGQPGRAVTLLEGVRQLVTHATGRRSNEVVALCNLGAALLSSGDLARAEQVGLEALPLAAVEGRPDLLALALQHLGQSLSASGRRVTLHWPVTGEDDSDTVLRDAEWCLARACTELARTVDTRPQELAAALCYVTEHRLAGGDLARAEDSLLAAKESAALADSYPIEAWIERLELTRAIRLGQADDRTLARLRHLSSRTRVGEEALRASLLLCTVGLDLPSEAAHVESLLDELTEAADRGPLPWLSADVLLLQARAALAAGKHEDAAIMADRALGHARRPEPPFEYAERAAAIGELLHRLDGLRRPRTEGVVTC
jgi:tetratricopeptide (TPR) repeat protein